MRFRGLVYRAHNPQWSWTPLSDGARRRRGGRFNRRGIPALYTSFTPLTAIREVQPFGRPTQPLTLCAYEIDVEPVFDVMDGARREALGVSDSDLECPAWEAEMLDGKAPSPQMLADRLIAMGYVAMRFAARSDAGDINLVLWRWDCRSWSHLSTMKGDCREAWHIDQDDLIARSRAFRRSGIASRNAMSVGVIDSKCYMPAGPSREPTPRGEGPNASAVFAATWAGEGMSERYCESDVWKPPIRSGECGVGA